MGAIDHLSACLALVRPAWMTDEAAAEWLTVAASDLAEMDPQTLAIAAKEARKTCREHKDIVPAIMASQAVKQDREFAALKRTLGTCHSPRPALSDNRQVAGLIETAAKALTGANR